MDLYSLITKIAADPDKAYASGFDVDVDREVVRLHSHEPYTETHDAIEELSQGEMMHPALDAENAPFTGTPHVVFWLAGEFKGWSAPVNDDGTLDIDDRIPPLAVEAMNNAFTALVAQLRCLEPSY